MANGVKTLPSTHRFEVSFPKFESLPSAKGEEVQSSKFTCIGHQWRVELYPGGDEESEDGMVNFYLSKLSKGKIKIKYAMKVKHENLLAQDENVFDDDDNWSWGNGIERSKLIELLDNGTLVVVVSIGQPDETASSSQSFVPPNPFIKAVRETYNDKNTSDILFVVGGQEIKEEGKKKAKTTPTEFHAHRLILKGCAPILADLCESYEDKKPISILDTKPDIFGYLLQYVYGKTIPEEELKANAKDIIDAADKYGVVGLKLEAESIYVKSTTITIDNVIEMLLYSHAKNCALLNEAVMDFIVEHGEDVMTKVSFSDVPGDVLPDLWASMARGKKENSDNGNGDTMNFSTMRVNTLRRMCHEKGLDIDGSRKTLIDLLTDAQENSD